VASIDGTLELFQGRHDLHAVTSGVGRMMGRVPPPPERDAPTMEFDVVTAPLPLGRAAKDGWRAPQHRDGMALVLSSAASSGIGMLFWVLAARLFDPTTVGLNSAALSAMTLLGSAAHLNLGNAVLRFVPVSDRRGRIVAGCFAVGIGVAAVLGLGFALGAGVWAPELVDAVGYPILIVFFVISTPLYTVFVLQDAALTAIKRADLVLWENLAFSLLKVALLAVAAWLALEGGIAIGWVVATLLVVLAVTGWLTRAVRTAPPAHTVHPVTVRDLGEFVGADYAGNIFWQAAVFGLPLVVINLAGPDGAAVYGVIWQIAFAFYLVAIGMGKSMVAHNAAAGRAAADRARRGMERKALTLIVPGALVTAAASYPILWVFGSTYAQTGTLLLILLVLSAIPNVVTNSTVWEARVNRRRAVLVGLPAGLCALVIIGTVVLVPMIGITGAGWAWLGAQCLAAAVVLLRRRLARVPASSR
jgi:O-antigen/teichoic acid export membrane protein